MGLLQTLKLRKKKNSDDSKDRLIDAQSALIDIMTRERESMHREAEVAEVLKPEPPMPPPSLIANANPAEKIRLKRKHNRKHNRKAFVIDLTAWFNRRSNKWLTKLQIQTMPSSPVKGVANSSFYRFIGGKEFEVNRSERPIKYRLRGKLVIPDAPQMYGASLTTIQQQLKGTNTLIAIHRTDCKWHREKKGDWLYAQTLAALYGKIDKLFKTYGKGKGANTKQCISCAKAGRLQLI
mgnify:CR=1 FL=1